MYLDKLQVEKERGITVKAQTASMVYEWKGDKYLLNLIDTPVQRGLLRLLLFFGNVFLFRPYRVLCLPPRLPHPTLVRALGFSSLRGLHIFFAGLRMIQPESADL